MTPKEYVSRLVEARGGRARQQRVCEDTGWSESSVSRMLTKMEDGGLIQRHYVGQEKIVSLTDEAIGPGAADDD